MSPVRLFPDLPPDSVAPDYGAGGLYGLVRGLAQHLGARGLGQGDLGQDSHGQGGLQLDLVRGKPVVVLLLDGLGADYLQRRGRGSRLAAACARTLTTVFPSTTASAIGTLMSGLAPAAHGLVGWTIRDQRFGGVLAPLPLTQRGGEPVRGWFAMSRLFPYRTLYQRISRPSAVIAPAAIADSRFNLRHARGASLQRAYTDDHSLIEAVFHAHAVLGAGGGFIYVYQPDFDSACHEHGCAAEATDAVFERLDALFARLVERLQGSGCELLVTADHGFVDVPAENNLIWQDFPDLLNLLEAPPWGERRLAMCAPRAGAEAEFDAAVAEQLGARVCLHPGQEWIEGGWFGPLPHHRRLAERVGSRVLALAPGWALADQVGKRPPPPMPGLHGGISAAEMRVPLIQVRC